MTRILVTGAHGQIGTELVEELRKLYGKENVIATDITKVSEEIRQEGPYLYLDVLDKQQFRQIIVDNGIDWIIHNASILSAKGEKNPDLALNVNARGLENALDIARQFNLRILVPSSIAAFGPSTPSQNTPDVTIQRPNTMYGITKVWVELLGEYYQRRWDVDFRSLRYPGIISYKGLPGGGTTDYAVDIFYQALDKGSYESFLQPDTLLPMMYMPDCIKGTIELISADSAVLKQRVFNLAAFSFTPRDLANEIRKHLPDFSISYNPDYRQQIADGWPNSLDDSNARQQWNWYPEYTVETMTIDMLEHLSEKLGIAFQATNAT